MNSNKQKIFREDELPQGSREWLAWRESHLGASEISCLTGDSFFGSAQDLWRLKTRRIPPVQANADMLRGKRLEPLIRSKIEEREKTDLQQFCLEHSREEFLSASLDGFDERNGIFWEMKAPRVAAHEKLYFNKKVPRWYASQMLQQQMILESHFGAKIRGFFASFVTDEALADFYQSDDPRFWRVPNLIVLPFEMCRVKETLLSEIGRIFWDFVAQDIEPTDFEILRDKIFGNKWRWN